MNRLSGTPASAAPAGARTNWIMRRVLLAMLPGIVAQAYFFGPGVLLNIAWAALTALACEACVLNLRRRDVLFHLRDGSALLTAVLLAIALPPATPWWLVMGGTVFAILVAKHLYGGLGHNRFNPAMAGYALLLISFPLEMSRWQAPAHGLAQSVATMSSLTALQGSLGLLDAIRIDAYTMATPLDILHHNRALLFAELRHANAQFGVWGGVGWEWVNAGFLCGGVFLLAQRIYSWHAPLAMLAALSVLAVLGYDNGSSQSGGPLLFHLFSGATMVGAFFIVTDPVTSAASNRGRLIYGALIGVLIYAIRLGGHYADGVAFAVLLGNAVAPLIDRFTQPRKHASTRRQES